MNKETKEILLNKVNNMLENCEKLYRNVQLLIKRQDQLIEDIRTLGRMGQNICPVCAHYNHGEGCKKCITCPKMDNFEWRGLVKEG